MMILRRTIAGFLAVTILASALMFTSPIAARAQGTMTAPAHKHNIFQRHPTMTGIAAGIATHHALKVSAARKKARGQKLNFAERHPTLSGIGVGAVTRHMIKKHTH